MPPGRRTFSYAEALASLPAVSRLTRAAVAQVEALVNRVQSRDEMESRRDELEAAMTSVVEVWTRRINALGCEARGPWLVDWDCGEGRYCWRYPEATISCFRPNEEDSSTRMPVN
jgi:hypothetical protein